MLTDRTETAERPAMQRSAVTNGRTLFAEGGDMRGAWARRLRDVLELHVSDLGGLGVVSEAERSILRRAATLTVELERLEARFAVGEGEAADLDLYQRATNTLRRSLESVGLKRVARDVTPSLHEYLAAKVAARPADSFSASEASKGDPETKRTSKSLNGSEGHSGGGR